MAEFSGRLALQQRVLPAYRAPFFDLLAGMCRGGMGVFAGQPGPGEAIVTTEDLQVATLTSAHNWHIGRVTSPFYLCWQRGLLTWLQEWQPDALIVEANPRYISTRLASAWMRAQGCPVLGWGLGVAPQRPAPQAVDRFRQPGRQRFLSQFDGLIAYSQQGAEQYQVQGFPADRIFVAPNAVTAKPESAPPERELMIDGKAVVLYVGRLQARKRLDHLLKACASLPEGLQPVVWIVGEGPERGALEELAADIYPHTIFYGAVHGSDLEPIYHGADVFVLPGTGGLAVQQAMAYGLPVIAAEGDGTLDDLVREACGWRVAPGDITALKNALRDALTDIPALRRKGQDAYQLVATEVNINRMAEVFIAALQAVGC